ncbi:uncharacterized protein LOC133298609 [Gastrolobium bilobum]|uniref:uncharacterized protein LOC133298609 n=1 Tax=Gastrolobium bilobum TaxID=150636 RepID=UPI002AB111A0|nr:uncharacterized protein LOC133298609 [Gastrolobium bilobum]
MGTCSGESADNKQVIAADTTRVDHIWSSNKMEGDEGLNTVRCLRGRLLAERQASRVAKEEEESMGNKLVELEKLLREEIKLREKAERKLKFLKKKLESFNMSGQLEHSDLSDKFENSCGSSSISSTSKHYSEANETKHHAKNPALPEIVVQNHNVSEAALVQTHNNSSTTKDCDSQITDNSSRNSDPGCYSSQQILSEDPNPSHEDLKNDESRLSSLSSKSSATENESDHADFCDNSLALVPVNMTATSQATNNLKPVNESVLEALDALRHARERLQSSMGRTRQMIHVGPI